MTARRVRDRAALAMLAAAVAIATTAVLALAPSAGALASPPAPAPTAPNVVVSPLPGTPDADPATQISFLGVPASQLRSIVVRGSATGIHAGHLGYFSTHTGGSFIPATPFEPGEHVTVTATVVGPGAPQSIGTNFTVGSPYVLPAPKPVAPTSAAPAAAMHFQSRRDLEPPAVTVTTAPADPTLGDIFVSPDSGPGQEGPMIVAPSGQLVWFKPLPRGTSAFDLNLQSYQGKPVLTWWQGQIVEGHGQGVDVIESARYTPIATVHAGNGLFADLHDFQITPQGTAWITAFAPEHWDLSALGGKQNGLIDDSVVQEIDVKTGLVMFDWHASGHVPITDSYMRIPGLASYVLDYFHINSIDPLPNGTLLLSARNTWATYLISEATGAVVWQLGGKRSSFALGPGVSFAWQHDAEFLPDGTLSLFNNDAAPPEAPESSALDIALDTSAHTATLVHQYTYPGSGIRSDSQGDVQLLANGDDFIGWGQAGEVSEFSPAGALTFDMHFAAPTNSYRAFRYVWSTQPLTAPALIATRPARDQVELHVSWNGATDVASWRVLAGASPAKLAAVGVFPSSGFETQIALRTPARYIRVQALSAAGALLRSSPIVR